MIDKLVINGDEFVNVPASVDILIEMGVDPSEAVKIIADHRAKAENERILSEQKAKKQRDLASITVTVDNMVFDANESSRSLMQQAITAAEITGETEHKWKLANNEIAVITLDQLKQALLLGIKAHGQIVLGENVNG